MPDTLTDNKLAVMTEQNLGLVHACCHRMTGRGVEYDDLFGAGCLGLVKAVQRFDASRGLRFSTYAVPVILGEIKRIFRDGGSIKVGRSLKELSLKATREKQRLALMLGREPALSELAYELGVTPEEAAEALCAAQPVLSLTASGEEGERQVDLPVESVEEEIGDTLALRELMARLPIDEQRLIVLRYFQGKTQTQTAEELDMTQVQVSRREKKILQNLRQTMLEE